MRVGRTCSGVLVLGVLVAAVLLVAPQSVHAQARGEQAIQLAQVDPLGNFFRGIFGRDRVIKRREQPRSQQRTQPRRSEPAAPKVVIKEKDPDARVVMVLGDSVAAGLAKGLEVTLAEDTSISVASIANGSSGLVRDDFYNWPAKIDETLANEEQRIDAIVLSVGINDRQRMRTSGARHAFRSPEWEALYKARITHILDSVTSRGIPIIWVGLAPARANRMSTDFLYFNTLYRDAVEDRGGIFVDVWTNFLDENERYSAYGPDIKGQRRLLRRNDGVNFTRAGSRKLAFYVERQIRRLLGTNGLVMMPGLSTRRTGPDPRETGIGYVVDLTGPIAAGSGELAGGPDAPPIAKDAKSAYQQVLVEGVALPLVGGVPADGTPLVAEPEEQAKAAAPAS